MTLKGAYDYSLKSDEEYQPPMQKQGAGDQLRRSEEFERKKYAGSSFHGLKTSAPLFATSATLRVARYRLCSIAVAANIVSITEGG
jgi:hypothetical protein